MPDGNSCPWAIVTGVAGAIGAATAEGLGEAGYRIIGIDRRPADRPPRDAFIEFDLARLGASEEATENLAHRVRAIIGEAPVRLLVNNAAVQRLGSVETLTWSDWTDTLHVNLSAPFLLAQALMPTLRASHGVIVNVGSVHARATKPGFAAYATSKAALHGLTHALAVDVGPDVRVVAIAPAAIDTPMLRAGFEGKPGSFSKLEAVHPAKRIGSPEEVARAIVWLASEQANFITGSVLWMDGGILSRLHDPE